MRSFPEQAPFLEWTFYVASTGTYVQCRKQLLPEYDPKQASFIIGDTFFAFVLE